jgi:thiol-disulfide isomerase/thioredoxin
MISPSYFFALDIKQYCFSIFFILYLILCPGFAHAQDFELKGSVQNGTLEKVFFRYRDRSGIIKDSAIVSNNTFEIKGTADEITELLIINNREYSYISDECYVDLYVEKGVARLSLDAKNFKNYNIFPSNINGDAKRFRNEKVTLIDYKLSAISVLLQQTKNEHERKRLLQNIDSIKNCTYQLKLNFISATPSYFSLFLLEQVLYHPEALLRIKDIEKAGKPVLDNFSNTELAKRLNTKMEEVKNNAVGGRAANFELIDIEDNKITLNDFSNKKFVLLDFWASWCVPCRTENPALIKLNDEFRKDLQIISISIDSDSTKWKKAIEEDKMNAWTNVLVTYKNNLKTFNDYAATPSIPLKILIDKKGIIVGRWSGSETASEVDKLVRQSD